MWWKPGIQRAAADSRAWFYQLVAAVMLVLGFAGGAPSTVQAATGPEYFGTNLQTLGLAPVSRWPQYFDQLAAGAMTVNRFEVDWYRGEPAAPVAGVHTYAWGATDVMIGRMADAGLRATPIFRFAPPWATIPPTPTARGDALPPSSYDDFGLFVAAFAARYGPSGTFWALRRAARPDLPPRPTLAYEIWNEVNLDQYAWNNRADPTAYATLLRVVRPIIKAVQPSAVLLGSLAWQRSGPGVSADYVARLGAVGGLDLLDGMAYHPYAPDAEETFSLVRGLRNELIQAGAPDMPIYANETGQPAVTVDAAGNSVPPGRIPAQHGYERFPSDAARGAALAFAGEALAASDCGVEQFMNYAVTSSESPLDPIDEGYMGIFSKVDATPNVSGRAMQRASLRWAARFASGGPGRGPVLALCSPAATADAALLRVPATVTGVGPGCARITTTWDGNPLESLVLRLRDTASGREVASARTDAFGNATACVPGTGQPFTVSADLPDVGRTGTVACDLPVVGCPTGVPLVPGADAALSARVATRYQEPVPPGTAPAAVLAEECAWSLTATPVKVALRTAPARSLIRVRALAGCTGGPKGLRVRLAVGIKPRGRKAQTRLTVVALQSGQPRTFDVWGPFRVGDQLTFVHREQTGDLVPDLRTVLPITRPKAAKVPSAPK